MALSGDGRLAVSISGDPRGSANTTIEVWEVENGYILRTLQVHSEGVEVGSVAISGDGQRAVSASGDKTLKVWEVESGRELRTLQGHSKAVFGVALMWRRAPGCLRFRRRDTEGVGGGKRAGAAHPARPL